MEAKNWRTYERDPKSKKYPDIKGQKWEDFLERFRRKRKRPTVTLSVRDTVLDGWQRYRACIETDIEPVFYRLREGEDEDDYVDEVNDYRRHETPEQQCLRRDQRIERTAAKRREGLSMRTIAEQENVSQAQVAADVKAATDQGLSVDPPNAKIRGRDGVLRPSTGRTTRRKRSGKKAGSILFAFTEINAPLGQLVRLIDKCGNAFGGKESPPAEGLRRLLAQFKSDFKRWYEFRAKTIVKE